jgi:hypothetical protein
VAKPEVESEAKPEEALLKPAEPVEQSDSDAGIPKLDYDENMDEDERQKAEDARQEQIRFQKQLMKDQKDHRFLWLIN